MPIFLPEAASSLFARALSQDCTLCGARSRQSLCTGCHRDLPFRATPGCPRCNVPTNENQVCGACLSAPPHFDDTTTAFDYAYPLDRLVQAFKFNANLHLLPLFADALTRAIRAAAAGSPALVVPLPLAPRRLAERGFNQSALLGERVSRMLGLRFEARGMLRVRDTPPQAGLNRDDRLKNVRGAFDCTQRLDGKHIAVVDDVMTTGASLSEVAKVLKKAGAVRVSAWVIARAAKGAESITTERTTEPFDGEHV